MLDAASTLFNWGSISHASDSSGQGDCHWCQTRDSRRLPTASARIDITGGWSGTPDVRPSATSVFQILSKDEQREDRSGASLLFPLSGLLKGLQVLSARGLASSLTISLARFSPVALEVTNFLLHCSHLMILWTHIHETAGPSYSAQNCIALRMGISA